MPKMGEIYRVVNKERQAEYKKRFSEDSTYFSIFIENEHGDEETTLLLTDKELSTLRVAHFPVAMTENLVLGRVYTVIVDNKVIYIIKLLKEDNTEYIVQVKQRLIVKARERANKHPETTPKKGWLQDIMD